MRLDRRSLSSLPVPLLAGYALSAAGALLVLRPHDPAGSIAGELRWTILVGALWFASAGLITAGWHELAQRAAGPARSALRIVTVCAVILTAWSGLKPVVVMWSQGGGPGMHGELLFYAGAASTAVGLIGAVAIVGAAGVGRHNAVPIAIVLGLLVLRDTAFYVPAIASALFAHPAVAQLLLTGTTLVWTGAVVVLALAIAARLPAGEPEPALARRGLARASGAMWFSILSAIGVGLVFATSIRSFSAVRFAVIGAPVVAIVALVVFASGLLAAARSRVAGLSAWLLVAGAAGVLWYVAILVRHAWALFHLLAPTDDYGLQVHVESLRAFQILGPAVAVIGMWLAIQAIGRFALARADFSLREAATVRGLLFLVLLGSSVALQVQVDKAHSEEALLLILLSAVGAAIGALIALAQTCTKGAEAVAADTPLPEARIV